jgi:hypothetical protein
MSQHAQFKKGMFIAEEEFLWALKAITQVSMPARAVFEKTWN